MTSTTTASLEERLNDLIDGFPDNAESTIEVAPKLRVQFEEIGDQTRVEKCLVWEIYAYHHLWRTEEARALLDHWEPIAQKREWRYSIMKFLNLRGIMARRAGDLETAGMCYHQGLEMAKDVAEKAAFISNLGHVFLDLGEYNSAMDYFQESLRACREIGKLKNTLPILYNLALVCRNMQNPALALRHLEEAVTITEQFGDHGTRTDIWRLIACCHGDQGNFAAQREALVRAEQAAREAPETKAGVPLGLQSVALERGKFLLQHGDATEGRQLVEAFLEEIPVDLEFEVPPASMLLAQHEDTRPEDAVRLLRLALSFAEKCSDRREQAEAHLLLYKRWKEEDDPAAWPHLERARELERELYSEESAKRLQAVAIQRESWDLRQELSQEQRVREETARLLAEVERQKERAEEADRAKTAILGIAAHDLSSQAGSIMLGMESLQVEGKRHASLAPWRKDFDRLTASTKELRQLLRRLLDYSAIQQGTLSSRPEPTDLCWLVTRCVEESRAASEKKGQTLALKLPDSARVRAHLDPIRISQVLHNLVSNALKFSPKGSTVEAQLIPSASDVRIEVRDRGPGLSEVDEKKLFRAFQTLSNHPTGGESSTGLGLHIAKAVIESEGGTLGYSPREGGGSVFWLKLPVLEGCEN